VKKTVAGLLKLIYPHRQNPDSLKAEEVKWVMDFGVEMRKRVTDQLAVILPTEYANVAYGFTLRNAVGEAAAAIEDKPI
jgi:predicted ATP-dependent Lon-type protease